MTASECWLTVTIWSHCVSGPSMSFAVSLHSEQDPSHNPVSSRCFDSSMQMQTSAAATYNTSQR